jgi:hypothetical protein
MAYTTINKPSLYFNTVLYTGNGSTQSITGVNFKPDFVWTKNRTNANSHQLFDAVRGVQKALYSNGTDVEETNANFLTAFNSDGFSVGSGAGINGNTTNVASWNWLAANSTTTNTSGTITSTVSANTTSGFSICTYSGSNSTGSFGHGLGVAPKMVAIKQRNGTGEWVVAFNISSWTWSTDWLSFDNNFAKKTDGGTTLFTSAPTSTVVNIGGGSYTSTSGKDLVAYCFAEIKGFSKFGSYTGNGSTDGTFVYTGFKPAYVMVKVISTADDWNVIDNKRDPYNEGSELVLYPNLSSADTAATRFDMVSNGFKMRTTNVSCNSAGATYVYAAFAENPFVSATGIPATAR